ncbi:MAG: hypothetical protein O7D34_00835, partial [Ignavibacteria bacterium]|nr:hypothetical protein [Ignavibacteria bacterium]
MGEIARRQFLNRMLVRGSHALQTGNPRLIYHFLLVHRASVFNQEITNRMLKGVENQIDSVWHSMPSIENIGLENFLDLMIVRNRFPNYGGVEQSRTDAMIPSYIPYAQPSFVQRTFEIPLRLRKNGRLFRKMILENKPSLRKYPLVKGNVTYPFIVSGISAWIWTKAKKACDGSSLIPRLRNSLTLFLNMCKTRFIRVK